MFLRILISGAVALPIALAGAAHARDAAGAPAAEQRDGISFSLPRLRLPGLDTSDEGVQVAQVADPRITQLEEQVRQLTGTLEELNFQILQMQDQLRRMQEDNELRFQQLEERRSGDAGGAVPPAQPRDTAQTQPAQGSGDDEYYATVPRVEEDAQVVGEPPRTFGTITFDENGNAIGAGVAPPPAQQPQGGADQTTVAALPSGGGEADELYRTSYELILSGDYGAAESGFRQLIETYPSDEHAADAHFWLGEALLAQEKPREAAEVFLAASRDFPDSRKAPDTLLKLGISLAAMEQRDVACATFVEVLERYPDANDALRERVKQEQGLASC